MLVPEVRFTRADESRLRLQIESLRQSLEDATNSSGRFSRSTFWLGDVRDEYERAESRIVTIRESKYFATSDLRLDWEAAAASKAELERLLEKLEESWSDHKAQVAQLREAVEAYTARSAEMVRTLVEPRLIGPYEVSVSQCRYDLKVLDFSSNPYALGDPRPGDLGQLAGGTNLFREPRISEHPGFVVDVLVRNTSSSQLLRPALFEVDSYTSADPNGVVTERLLRVYNFIIVDGMGNELRFYNDPNATSAHGKSAIRPGDSLRVDLRFNRDNAPVATAGSVTVRFDSEVFGSPLAVQVPRTVYSLELLSAHD